MRKILVGAVIALGIGAAVVAGVSYLRPDWLPRPGAASAQPEYGLYCEEHGVPEKFCTLCHPELKEKLLLCTEHGSIPEDVCTLCHPELAKKHDIKPCEHGLPAHFCPKCHPENFKDGGSASAGPELIDDGWCKEFGEKGPDGLVEYCKLLPMVRLASTQLVKDVGLGTASVEPDEHAHELTANAETAYNANRFAEITPRARGYVREARVDLGRKVKAGEVLAIVDSSEVSTAKAQYIAADAALKLAEDSLGRTGTLVAEGVVGSRPEVMARTALNQAKANLLDVEQRLRNFQFDDDALRSILRTSDAKPPLEIRSPLDGTVILRHAVNGEAVEPATSIFTVADTSTIWLWIDVYERDVAEIREGQAVSFVVSGLSSQGDATTHAGRITWVGAGVDERTRTTKVRAELPNPDGKLRSGQYGKVRIRVDDAHEALTVAKAAVQRYEGADIVFLTQGGSSFRPQRIKSRPIHRSDVLEVTWGLKSGQEVVTDGSFLLKTEIMKGSIGAGCCE